MYKLYFSEEYIWFFIISIYELKHWYFVKINNLALNPLSTIRFQALFLQKFSVNLDESWYESSLLYIDVWDDYWCIKESISNFRILLIKTLGYHTISWWMVLVTVNSEFFVKFILMRKMQWSNDRINNNCILNAGPSVLDLSFLTLLWAPRKRYHFTTVSNTS